MNEVCEILQKLFLSGDIPERLGADNAFESIRSFCDKYGVELRIGLPHAPQSQGFVENKNKQIKNLISHHFLKTQSYKYFDILDHIAFTINNTKHSITNTTPLALHRGREINIAPHNVLDGAAKDFQKQILIVNNNERVNDDPTEAEIENYKQTNKFLHEARVEHAKTLIYKAAEQRENFFKEKEKPIISDNSRVAILSYKDLDHEIQPIYIQLKNKEKSKDPIKLLNPLYYFSKTDPVLSKDYKIIKTLHLLKKIPKTTFPATMLKTKKYVWKFPVSSSVYRVSSMGHFFIQSSSNNNKIRTKYKVNYIEPDGTIWNVEQIIKVAQQGKEEITEPDFQRQFLFELPKPLTNSEKQKEVKYMPEYMKAKRQHVIQLSSTAPIPEVTNINVNANQIVDQEQDNIIAHENASDRFEKIYHHSKTQPWKKSKLLQGIKIQYLWEYYENGNSVLKLLEGTIIGWDNWKPKQLESWEIKFDDGETLLLRLYKYNYVNFFSESNLNTFYKKHNWRFSNPENALQTMKIKFKYKLT
jgi:hypothetical protein